MELLRGISAAAVHAVSRRGRRVPAAREHRPAGAVDARGIFLFGSLDHVLLHSWHCMCARWPLRLPTLSARELMRRHSRVSYRSHVRHNDRPGGQLAEFGVKFTQVRLGPPWALGVRVTSWLDP